MKKQFTATFEDGTVKTRKSEAEYTHAYKITSTTGSVEYGFSKTYELCAKAAAKKAHDFWFDLIGSRNGWAIAELRRNHELKTKMENERKNYKTEIVECA